MIDAVNQELEPSHATDQPKFTPSSSDKQLTVINTKWREHVELIEIEIDSTLSNIKVFWAYDGRLGSSPQGGTCTSFSARSSIASIRRCTPLDQKGSFNDQNKQG
jgi:hypothetical protein